MYSSLRRRISSFEREKKNVWKQKVFRGPSVLIWYTIRLDPCKSISRAALDNEDPLNSCYPGLCSDIKQLCLFVCLVGFLTSSSTTRLYRGRAPRQSLWQFYVLPHMRQSWETMTSISAGHIILTPTQPVGSGRQQRGSNPGPPDQESRALQSELPRAPIKQQNSGHYRVKSNQLCSL